MGVVKAEYLVAQDSNSDEEQNVKFIPPEPSGNDLGGITEDERRKLVSSVYDNAGAHNAIYRGKDLGSSVTQEQYNNIANGTFNDLYIGDYWTLNRIKYVIADFDYMYNVGDTALTKHHIVVVPEINMYTYVMNDANTTEGGYVASKMFTKGLNNAIASFKNAFGENHVLTYRNLLTTAVSGDSPSNSAWQSRRVDVMNEAMVYGQSVLRNSLYDVGCQKSQLNLFKHRHDAIQVERSWYWLRDVYSATKFVFVGSIGNANVTIASNLGGVRPFALIG